MRNPNLFRPLTIRTLTLKNRIVVSPMAQYSAEKGSLPSDWHFVHIGARAIGGAGLIFIEATAVESRGLATELDLGLWNSAQASRLQKIVELAKAHHAAIGIQLSHSGRRASCEPAWDSDRAITVRKRRWEAVAPSPLPFSPRHPIPRALAQKEILRIVERFGQSAELACRAGFDVIEIQGAHGNLIHSFLSPISNVRADEFGGSFENRVRFSRLVVQEIRRRIPRTTPLFFRLSLRDGYKGGWSLGDSIALSRLLKQDGVDLVDCSAAGLDGRVRSPGGLKQFAKWAHEIKKKARIQTAIVGGVRDSRVAERVIGSNQAALLMMTRELLRDPNWPLRAAEELGAPHEWPKPYDWALRRTPSR